MEWEDDYFIGSLGFWAVRILSSNRIDVHDSL